MIKTVRHQTYHKVVKHTFREQFATGAGRGKKMQSVSCAAKYDPKGRETRILGLNVRMKIVSCFLFWADKEKQIDYMINPYSQLKSVPIMWHVKSEVPKSQ